MSKYKADILRKISIFVAIFFLCIVLKTIACWIPGGRIKANIEASSIGQRLGYNYVTLPITTSIDSRLDYFTECIYMSVCILSDTEHPFISAIENYEPVISKNSQYYDCEGGAWRFAALLLDGSCEGVVGRDVYWFGTVSFLRPLLAVMTYDHIIALVQIIAYSLWAVAFLSIYKVVGLFPAFSFILTSLLINIHVSFMLLCTVMPFIISFIHIICIPWMKNKETMMDSLLITGMLTAYYDWFSTPIITFAYPTLMLCMLLYKNGILSTKTDGFRILLNSSIHWIGGYAGMIIAKWCLASIVLHKNTLFEGIAHMHGDITKYMIADRPDNIFRYIYETFRNSFCLIKIVDCFPWKYVLVAGCVIVTVIIILLIKEWKNCSLAFTVFLCSLAPIAWLIVFHGHMFAHPHFTYRNFGVFLWGIALFFYYMWKTDIVDEADGK